jgi:hypothetical protein
VMEAKKFLTRELIEQVTSVQTLLNSPSAMVEARADLRDALMEVAGRGSIINALILGKWLGNNVNIPVGGLVLRSEEDTHTQTKRWWVARA